MTATAKVPPRFVLPLAFLLAGACAYDRQGLGNAAPPPDANVTGPSDGPNREALQPIDASGTDVSTDQSREIDAQLDRAPRDVAPDANPVAVDATQQVDQSPDSVVVTPDAAPDAAGCPESHGGPELVRVGAFCIDATEVTNAQYAVFWNERRQSTSGQVAVCAWNTSFTPEGGGGAPWPSGPERERRPVVNVDWCDAYAFCQWAGKRLCGRIGQGSLARWRDTTDASVSQWTYACTSGGRLAWPYGNAYNPAACNAERMAPTAASLVDVASKPGCRTDNGVYDLSGNVEEWTDACDAANGPNDLCAVVGASALHQNPNDLSCTGSPYPDRRSSQYELRGFRCCAP
jgi:formylglycine-generating enzyme required for sulfatase activity